MNHYETSPSQYHASRALIGWNLLLASAILILPVVVLLPLAYVWRKKAYRTVYHSHFSSMIRYGWMLLLMPFVAIIAPWVSLGVGLALIVMFIAILAAVEGRKAVLGGVRFHGVLA